MKAGRPFRKDIDPLVKEILEEQSSLAPTEIQRRYNKKTGENIHVETIKKALKRLVVEGVVIETVINRTERRVTAVYGAIKQ